MPPRQASLESLSSPSPSPSPAPADDSKKSSQDSGASSSRMAHLGSDSELSELTEEEQEAAESNSKSTNARRSQANVNGRGSKHPRRGGRRKRSTLVPAPMWGWVPTKGSDSEDQDSVVKASKATKQREESVDEEKELPEEVVAEQVEEEEEEDQPQSALVVPDEPEISPLDVLSSAAIVVETARNEDVEQTKDDDETDAEVGDDEVNQPDTNPNSNPQSDSESDDQPEVESEIEADVDITAPPLSTIGPIVAAASASSIMGNSTGKLRASPSANSSRSNGSASLKLKPTVNDPTAVEPEPEEDGEDEENAEDPEDDGPKTITRKPRNMKGKSKSRRRVKGRGKPKPSPITIPDITKDITTTVATIGDKLVEVEIEVEAEVAVVADAEPGEEEGDAEPDADAPAEPAAEEEEMDVDVEEEEPEEPEEEERDEREEPEDVEDIDEGEAAEEDDEEELDLQPAHRIEALEVLASIELRFALVREKLYVEKMQSLAWEESLVENGTHPEFIYLQNELERRKDKRLELAARKRTYEFSHVSRKRKLEEDATWSWWKLAKDELQIDMIAETNRKKRRLERDRRQMERPIPIRTIPGLPPDILTSPPTLRQLINNPPFGSREMQPRSKNKHRSRDNHVVNAISGKRDMGTNSAGSLVPLAYPELPTLSSADVNHDLDYLLSLSARKSGPVFDHHGHVGPVLHPHSSLHNQRDPIGYGHNPQRLGTSSRQHQQQAHPLLPTSTGNFHPVPPGPNGFDGPSQHVPLSYPPHSAPPPGPMVNEPYPSSIGKHAGQGPMGYPGPPYNNGMSLGPRPGSSSGLPPTSSAGSRMHHISSRPPPSTTPGSSAHHGHVFPGMIDDMIGHPPPPRDRERERERDREREREHEREREKHMTSMAYRRSMSPVNAPSASKESGQWMGAGMGMGNFGMGAMGHGPSFPGMKGPRWTAEDDERERFRREKRDREFREMERDRDRQPPSRHSSLNGPPRISDNGLALPGGPGMNQPGAPGTSHSPAFPPHHHHHGKPHHHHVLHHHHHMHGSPSSSPTHSHSHPQPGGPMTSPNMSRGEVTSKGPSMTGSRPPSVTEDKDREREREKERDRPVATPFALGASQYAKIPPGSASAHPGSQVSSPRPSWGTPPPPPPKSRASDEYLSSKSGGATPALSGFGPPPPTSSLPKSPPPRIPPIPQVASPRSMTASGSNSRTHSPTLLRERSPPLGLSQKGLINKAPPDMLNLSAPDPPDTLKVNMRDDDFPVKGAYGGSLPSPAFPHGTTKPISESPRLTRMSVPQILDS